MALLRMDNVGIVVDDLDAAIAFFEELGLELDGRGEVEGDWVDRTVGLTGVHCAFAMLRTPDGRARLELAKYHSPGTIASTPPNPPHNTLGMHRIMFAVDDIDDTISRLRKHGAEPLDGVGQFENTFRLSYLRGPAGVIIALAEQIS
jgi:catechol 2,3-dioxygenase-like lactoylglutathione lyase family enzyme